MQKPLAKTLVGFLHSPIPMAAFQLPSTSLALSHLQLLLLRSPRTTNTLSLFPIFNSKPITCIGTHPTSQSLLRASINSQTETPKPKRRRKKKSETPSSSSTTPTPTKRRSKKVEIQHEAIKAETETSSTPTRLRSNKAEGEDGVIEAESETSSSTTPTRRRTKNAEGENGEVKPKRTRKKKAKETTAEAVQAVEETKEEVSFQEMYEEDEEERKKKEKELDDKIFAKVARVLLSCQEDRQDEEDDGKMASSYTDPPLLCCFGAAQKEFLPTVRVSERQMHPDIYSTWKQLQWDPPEFARAPGGPPSNVAISHVRLGGRAAFMGKVGLDRFGNDLVVSLIKEKVSIRGVTYDPNSKTAASYMKFKFEDDGRMIAETVKESAEDSLLSSELIIAVLKEARIFHFNSEVLLTPSMHSSFFRAIELSKKYGGMVFFDLNLPLPLWRSRNETREIIKKAWDAADIVEVTRHELEFLLDEEYYLKKRNYKPQYYAESFEQTKSRRDYYHYSREEIAPLWHDGMKFLFVTDGTLRIHYYGPSFDGVVVGTEDVLITPYTCDRTGSGDTVVAAIMRKLMAYPKMFEDEDMLVRQLRFAIAAGIISQWTIGAVRGFPTESAAQNLKEQVYVPSMW